MEQLLSSYTFPPGAVGPFGVEAVAAFLHLISVTSLAHSI